MISGIGLTSVAALNRRTALRRFSQVRLTSMASARNSLKPFYVIGRRRPALKLRAIRLAWRMFSCPISGMKSKNFVQVPAAMAANEACG
jgi:hypothetical protein